MIDGGRGDDDISWTIERGGRYRENATIMINIRGVKGEVGLQQAKTEVYLSVHEQTRRTDGRTRPSE